MSKSAAKHLLEKHPLYCAPEQELRMGFPDEGTHQEGEAGGRDTGPGAGGNK